jgi:hypothetical protein
MDKIIIERANVCDLVKERNVENGYDSDWGNIKYYIQEYVIINGKKEDVFDSEFIVHDGKNVFAVFHDYSFSFEIKRLLNENYEKELKEERFKKYEKLKKEFEK